MINWGGTIHHMIRSNTKHKVRTSMLESREVMVRGAQTIRRSIGWDSLVDATAMRTYLMSEHAKKKPCDASMEVKNDRSGDEDEENEPTNKRNTPSGRKTTPEK